MRGSPPQDRVSKATPIEASVTWKSADLEPFLGYLAATARGLVADEGGGAGVSESSELVQQTVVRAILAFAKGRGPGRDEGELKFWLRGIMLNVQRESRRKRGPTAGLADDGRGIVDDASSVGTKLRRSEVVRLITRAKAEIGERDRQLLDWKLEDKLSFDEIGQRPVVSSAAAHKGYHKAIARLEEAFLKTLASETVQRITREWTLK